MAGSFNHCVNDKGQLRGSQQLAGMLENGGDVYEAVEEMYGMIWYLARSNSFTDEQAKNVIEFARQNYEVGVAFAKQALK
jgi:hypothetical protein